MSNDNSQEAISGSTVHETEGLNMYGRHGRKSEVQKIDPEKKYYKPWLASYPKDVPEFVETHNYENLVELFDESVKKHSSTLAYCNMGSDLTFTQVGELADAFAAFLQLELKLKKGDKLAIMLPNLMQYPVVFFGALKAGLTIININPLYTPRELQVLLADCDASAIVVISSFAANVDKIIENTKLKHVIVSEIGDCLGVIKGYIVDAVVHLKGLVPHYDFSSVSLWHLRDALRRGRHEGENFVPVDIAYDDIALLQYTGGTTGRPKGAMLSHGNLIANMSQALGVYGQVLRGSEEVILTVIPLYHIFALTVNLLLFFHIGGRNILITDPRDLKSFVKQIKAHPEISAMTGVNTLFNLFISNEHFQDIDWSHLRLVIGGGAAVQSGVEQRFFEKTGLHILEGYGLTECSPLVAVCPYTTDHYTGSIGLIVPSTIARIINADGEEITDTEHEGELEIKGPQVMHGYYKCERHNDYIFDDGFVRTGDIAKWMDGGYIKLIDRLKDMILVSGFNVFPNEIEDLVSRFNRILECAVIGVPSEKTGEAVKLFVVKKDPTLTKAEVKTYCRAYLTPYKVPQIIEFVDSLPKSALGKVLRRQLREQEQQHSCNDTPAAPLPAPELTVTASISALPDKAQKPKTAGAMALEKLLSSHDNSYSVSELPSIYKVKVKDAEAAKARAKLQAQFDAIIEKTEQQEEENASVDVPKKTQGALALEKLLSSRQDAFDMPTTTPNIHKKEERHVSQYKDRRDSSEQDEEESLAIDEEK